MGLYHKLEDLRQQIKETIVMTNNKKTAIFGVLIVALAFVLVAFTTVNAEGNPADTNLQISTATPVPAPDQPREMLIENRTSRNITIYLDGEKDYEIVSPSGDKYFTIDKGLYSYEYTLKPCGLVVEGETNVLFDGHIFELLKCPPAPRLAQDFAINSHYDFDVLVDFTPNFIREYKALEGDSAFALNVLAGERNVYNNNNFVEGDYIYTYEACGETLGGTIRLLFDYKNEITLKGCEAQAFQQELTDLGLAKFDLTKLRLNNRVTDQIFLTLYNGPKSYYFTVDFGVDIVNVYTGTYDYVYAVHGQTYRGSISVSPNGDTVMMVPGSIQ